MPYLNVYALRAGRGRDLVLMVIDRAFKRQFSDKFCEALGKFIAEWYEQPAYVASKPRREFEADA